MPALPNRTAHEQAITAQLLAEYTKLADQAKRNPQSIDWKASEDESQRDVADELATVYLIALFNMHAVTEQDFNQHVAVALATDWANQRSAEVVSNLYDDLRADVSTASSQATQSILNGVAPDEAKRQYEAQLTTIFEPIRPGTIGVTEVTAAISAGEYAVGKPDKNNWWLALVLLYGVPNAYEAWKNRQPGQPIRDLIGWPRTPGRRDTMEPAPGEWPTPTPRREMPKGPSDLPGDSQSDEPGYTDRTGPQSTPPNIPNTDQTQPPTGQDGSSGRQQTPTIPSVLMPYWQIEADEYRNGRLVKACSICAPLDGLAEDHWWTRFPGGPPAHPSCRCELRWVNAEALES